MPPMAVPQPGAEAPDFELPASGGGKLRLSSLRGKRVVLYTYPKDDTPGCTIEARGFSERISDIEAQDAVVVGMNNDDTATHDAWIAKMDIPFVLVSDLGGEALSAYDSYGTMEWQGETFPVAKRNTFLIDRQGRIARVWEGVDPNDHVDEVLAALREL